MNVKTLGSNIVAPLESLKNTEVKKEVRSEESSDRDADGRRDPDFKPIKEELTEEELQQVLEALKKVPGVKDHNLVVRYQIIDHRYFFFIEDLKGKVVRRMKTSEAWAAAQAQDQKTGNLLNKSL